MKLKYYVQKFIGLFLKEPIIPDGRTVGYSLVKSEKFKAIYSSKVRIYAPYFLHDVRIGNYSYIARNCSVSNTCIGRFCSIGPNFCCGLGSHPINGISTSPMFYSTLCQNGFSLCKEDKVQEYKHTEIGHDVFIGANVTVLDGVSIGVGAVIGAGAVVTDDIPPYAVAVGVPARVIRYRFGQEQIRRLLDSEWWLYDDDKLKDVEKHLFDIDNFLS